MLKELGVDATSFVFSETFTNPLVRAQDIARLVATVASARERAPGLRLLIDSTIATPWAFRTTLLDQGVDVVIGGGTKALGGTDRDLWGYIATNAHVVDDADTLTVVLYDGRAFDAVAWVMDEQTDLAVVAIEPDEELPYARFLSNSLTGAVAGGRCSCWQCTGPSGRAHLDQGGGKLAGAFY